MLIKKNYLMLIKKNYYYLILIKMNSSMRFFGKRVALNKFELRKSIIQITKDLKDSIKIMLTDDDPNLSGQALHDRVERIFNNHYRSVKDIDFVMSREGMELLYEEEKKMGEDEWVTLYIKVTPKALSILNHMFEEEQDNKSSYLPNGVGPIDHLFKITVIKNNPFYNELTKGEFDNEFLSPYMALLHKRVQLGYLSSDPDDQPLMDKYLGKQKRHSRSRKLRQSRSRKLRHSRSRK